MDFARLREIDQLFMVRWEAFALASLADGPLRYRELWRAMNRHAQANVTTTAVTRLTKNLVAAGLIAQSYDSRRSPYFLTKEGELVVERINGVVEAVALLNEAVAATDREAEG